MIKLILISALLLVTSNGWAEQICRVDVPNIEEVGQFEAWGATFFDIEMNCEGTEILRVEFQPFNYPKTELIDSIVATERQLGLGGSKIESITKHKMESVGVVMNDLPSIRFDPVGKIVRNEVLVFPEGVATSFKAIPLVEPVDVEDLPGGTSTLNIANKYNIAVGSGGVSFKTTGPMEIGGTITNLAGEQINIASENEIEVNADYFKELVAKQILWKATEKVINAQKIPGYRANIVTYSLAWMLLNDPERFELKTLWEKQKIDDEEKVYLNIF